MLSLALVLAFCVGTPPTVYLDQPYGGNAWHVFDAYVPANPVAVAVFVHGLGNAASDEDINPLSVQDLFDRGIAVVSCDYAGYDTQGGVFPVPQRDVARCLVYLDSNRASYGLGTAKLGLMGKSYGSMLSAGVCYAPPSWYPGLPSIDFFVDFQGMMDWRIFAMPHPAWTHVTSSPFSQATNWASGQWLLEQAPVSVPDTYTWNDLLTPGTPPLADPHDPFFGIALHDALDRLGVTNELHLGDPVLDMAEVGDFILASL